ncbi:hypothetical protein QAD02_012064 [Eretmocerus hayati]|uniref:Uncharacterized protein n=1 Tax=Eretmocerus hayati TaxID=131215 RepID=A0ACC2NZH3_9HYME|nr:hypothetical protein QAD02_012064 [Eretmocerus hayati]
MKQLPDIIRNWGFDPVTMPNTSRNIGGFWFTLGTSVNVNLLNGRLHGLSNTYSIKNLNVKNDILTKIEGIFFFPELTVYHDSQTRVLFKDVYKAVNSTLQNVTTQVSFFIDTASTAEVVRIDTKQLQIGDIEMVIDDDSNSKVMKYFVEEVRPRILQLIPDIVDEASSHLMSDLKDKINNFSQERRLKVLNDMGLLSMD